MEPPHFGLSRYAMRWWRTIRPDSAKRDLVKQASLLPPSQKKLLQIIYENLPEGTYKSLDMQQQKLVDAGIYIAANQHSQAAFLLRTLMENQPTDKEWILQLITELERISTHA